MTDRAKGVTRLGVYMKTAAKMLHPTEVTALDDIRPSCGPWFSKGEYPRQTMDRLVARGLAKEVEGGWIQGPRWSDAAWYYGWKTREIKMSETPKKTLNAEVKTTIHVNWSSYNPDPTQTDLSGFIAQALGLGNKHLDILEGANDSTYEVDATAEGRKYYDDEDGAEAIEYLKKVGGIEEYKLNNLICGLVVRGLLDPGHYVISHSW